MRGRTVSAILLVVSLVALPACSNPTYDVRAARDKLVDAGLTEQQAACITDGMSQRFARRRLDSREIVTRREKETFAEIVAACTRTGE